MTKGTFNGVELPSDFDAELDTGHVAFSRDGKKYAMIKDGEVVIGNLPKDGKVFVDGICYDYHHIMEEIQVRISDMHQILGEIPTRIEEAFRLGGGTMFADGRGISGSVVVMGCNKALESISVDESYNLPNGRVVVNSRYGNINLGHSSDDQVRVRGSVSTNPRLGGGKGTLCVDDLVGELLLPSQADLQIDIDAEYGNIWGSLSHGGNIDAKYGNVSLTLDSPLMLVVSHKYGNANVSYMEKIGDGTYKPARSESVGTLRIDAKYGNVTVYGGTE